ncbi:MAG: MFS transporter [Clostridia bacterium]|nr:MFS transporter [Clostridia bacterium]
MGRKDNRGKVRQALTKTGNQLKNAAGIEGNFATYIKPMAGYTCANITLGGAWYPINLYHQQYLSFVEQMPTHITGTISMINGIIDAVSDVVMGLITDRTRSKYGKHRLYVLLGAIPFFFAYIMKWCSFGVSSMGNMTFNFIYYLATSFIYSTSFTMMSVPHVAMLPTIEPDYFRRTQYKMVEYMFNSVGQIISFVFMGFSLGGFNLPDPSPDDRGKYLICGIVLAVWFVWSPILSFFTCPEPSSLNLKNDPINWKYLFNEYYMVFKNRSFRQYFLISIFNSFRASFYSYSDQYFIISIADKYSHFNLLTTIAGAAEFAGSPFIYFLTRFFDKRRSGLMLTPIMLAGLGINAFITHKTPVFFLYLAAILYNFGFSGPGFVLETIQPDITDVDELITGRRREGVIATFKSFVSKTISSFMTGILGFSLKFFGYDVTKKKPLEQTARTIFGLRLNFSIMPIIFGIITLILIKSFSMTKNDHEEIQRVIKEKYETGTVTISDEQKKRLERIAGQKWEDMWIGQYAPVKSAPEVDFYYDR